MAQSMTPEEWKECVRQRYPKLLERAHFLPPVYMSRQVHQTDTQSVPGVELNIPQSPVDTHQGGASILKDSDVRDDRAQQVVLKCLGKIADGQLPGIQPQVMFVLSQLNFGDYLNDPCYTVALPRPVDQKMKGRNLNQGDFDVVIIHRQHGLLAGEIKSIGSNAIQRGGLTDGEVLNVLRKMMKMGQGSGVGQVGKAREVLTHMMTDLTPPPTVRTTLMLPYISTAQLQRVLQSNQGVKKKLCAELGLPENTDPTGYCFCSDHVTDDSTLQQFWTRLMSGPCQAMSDDMYEDIVARFAGPATVVRIHCPNNPTPQSTDFRTEGEYVNLAGDRTAADVFSGQSLTPVSLYPDQVRILQMANKEENRYLYLAGPPGTGKTLMLVMAALGWLCHFPKVHVFILVTTCFNTAVGYFIKQQLTETARRTIGEEAANRVHFLKVELNETEEKLGATINDTLKKLAGVAKDNDGQLCLIADETSDVQNGLAMLHDRLQEAPFKRVRLWAASYEHGAQPHGARLHVMDVPLRCPPYVTQEVLETAFIRTHKDIKEYAEPSSPPPCDGPRVIPVEHTGHSGRNTTDCQQCGKEIASILKDRLHIGKAGGATSNVPQYMDVFVLTHHESDLDQAGVVLGLRKGHVPVRVVKKNDDKSLGDVGTRQGPDHVIVTYAENVRGLERKVVVFLQGNEETVSIGRLNIVSRCTSQLIWVR